MRVSSFLMLILLVGLPARAEDAVTLFWQDLLPANEASIIQKLTQSNQSLDPKRKRSSALDNDFLVVEALDGYKVRIPGFIVPLEFSADGRLSDFLLVPYQGACIHEPPPDPNQIVYAKSKTPEEFPNMWTPVWLTGTLSTKHHLNNLGDAAYTLDIESWELFRGY